MKDWLNTWYYSIKKGVNFIGPGIILGVSYMDPGNYSTSVSAGSLYQYKLLFIIFLSNISAVLLQCLCIKLGTITGLDLGQNCRLHLPEYLNLTLYFCAELAIVATDLAEVVGTAIALEILFNIPLFYGVLITVLDVLIVLMAYKKNGSMKQTRIFEVVVSILVLATCICFILELFGCNFPSGSGWEIFKGFLPSDPSIFKEKDALFISCGIVGSTVMPHSLYLGSALVQPRLKQYDVQHGYVTDDVYHDDDDLEQDDDHHGELSQLDDSSSSSSAHEQFHATISKFRSISDGSNLTKKYRPSYEAIKYCLNYSYAELILSLFTIAVFVNSAILIVAGNSLFGKPDAEDADLLSIYEMLSRYISPAAGLIFALSMLFAGQSAGIVCTMAGQIVSEGFINWSVKPWIRRIITRVFAIIPVLIFISILGREGVSKIMNSSQVVLSFILPIVSAPLIWFTCNKKYMTVYDTSENLSINENTTLLSNDRPHFDSNTPVIVRKITFENGIILTAASVVTWVIIAALNIYLVIAFANGANI